MDIDNILKNARTLAEQGKKEEAQMCLLSVLKEQPDNIAALLMLGGAYFVDNNYKEAKIIFERLVSLEPAAGQYSIALFNTLIRLHEADEALEEIRRFMSVADKHAEKEVIDEYLAILDTMESQGA